MRTNKKQSKTMWLLSTVLLSHDDLFRERTAAFMLRQGLPYVDALVDYVGSEDSLVAVALRHHISEATLLRALRRLRIWADELGPETLLRGVYGFDLSGKLRRDH